MSYSVIIPARFSSSRLPGKPLIDLGGLPMIVRVAQKCKETAAKSVIVATDHLGIQNACKEHGFDVEMTDPNLVSGTDRVAHAAITAGLSDDDIVVNVQGDEPLIPAEFIDKLAHFLKKNPDASMATACAPIRHARDLFASSVVKVVINDDNKAIYFSRAPIPYDRDSPNTVSTLHQRHVGVYAYKVSFLKEWLTMSESPIESLEKLEQLRALAYGHKIAVMQVEDELPHGVDTPEDAERVRAFF